MPADELSETTELKITINMRAAAEQRWDSSLAAISRGGHHASDPTGMSVPDGVPDPGPEATVP